MCGANEAGSEVEADVAMCTSLRLYRREENRDGDTYSRGLRTTQVSIHNWAFYWRNSHINPNFSTPTPSLALGRSKGAHLSTVDVVTGYGMATTEQSDRWCVPAYLFFQTDSQFRPFMAISNDETRQGGDARSHRTRSSLRLFEFPVGGARP